MELSINKTIYFKVKVKEMTTTAYTDNLNRCRSKTIIYLQSRRAQGLVHYKEPTLVYCHDAIRPSTRPFTVNILSAVVETLASCAQLRT